MKINNINLLLMTATENQFYFPIKLSGAANTAPTADSVVSRAYIDNAIAGISTADLSNYYTKG
jgi:hypothetical protein